MRNKLIIITFLVGLVITFVIFTQMDNPISETKYTSDDFRKVPLNIMTYNVLMGLEDTEREEAFIDYMNDLDVDVLALQELNGIWPKELKKLASSYGHNHSVMLKITGYPIGITSKYPIELISKNFWGYHHGMLHVKIQGINFIIVHLSPESADKRVEETERILDYMEKKEILDKQDVIILGDFNAHSKVDEGYILDNDISGQTQEKNLIDGIIDFRVIDYFMDSGFKETYAMLNDVSDRTFVTWSPRKKEKKGERIDFILASHQLADYFTESEILVNEKTEFISDHFPIIVKMKE
ncbi:MULTISPECIES: endonuclease/exonuclease/phosphatase family protein [unclassified Fusibacter]|uniref:endonuclease/exonuclease/phosphatase family protein n=1 Tax=unclassified Fusibacter TaxID=2624464 RepID=UPI00101353AE|nr:MULTISPECIES: endonuclease/exonuclease/phosphatase family protein [unclassified Fusibacter]MCK8061627.1 endonuclease/exonuclease/phosphatase family protein [Fusibacter sp. A2]NPE23810.1 endonuclease/exonuclease/phosphatase family protein [Fusibacter sp. A1]RXV58648.1 endonuclease/exonuclease/phosphatase family protein [Fusibacter sp. A1]